ncbi:MIP family Ig-specific serine endopeptidase [Mycoplasma sp. 3341]|uniref:MIP family Ig-specific serine endopeptidase n=1 Tax=Mycoplasma sp. 3341 TaxID=3447506 RepID=UPI003F660BAA
MKRKLWSFMTPLALLPVISAPVMLSACDNSAEKKKITELEINIQQLTQQLNNNKDIITQLNKQSQDQLSQIQQLTQSLSSEKTEKESAQTQLEQKIKELNDTNSQILARNEQISSLEKQLNSLQDSLKTLSQNYQDIQKQNQDLTKAVEDIQKDNDDLKQSNEKLLNEFKYYSFDKDKYYSQNPQVTSFSTTTESKNSQLVTNQDYLNSIANRTFSFTIYTPSKDPNKITANVGTTWLLDYKNIAENKWRLYLATNYHVALLFSQLDRDFAEYKQPDVTRPITSISVNFINPATGKIVVNQLAKNAWPKIFYMARNFMDKSALSYPDPDNVDHYADFAVLEWNINTDEFLDNWLSDNKRSLNVLLLNHILDAKQEFDSLKKYGQEHTLTNISKESAPYMNLDYATVQSIADTNFLNRQYTKDNITSIQRANEASEDAKQYLSSWTKYTAIPNAVYWNGFFLDNKAKNLVSQIYNIGDENLEDIDFSNSKPANKLLFQVKSTLNNRIISEKTSFNGRGGARYYGIHYQTQALKGSRGGTSGTMVTNSEGMTIGLVFGNMVEPVSYTGSDGTKYELKSTLIQPLTVTKPIIKDNIRVEAYNLIDNTDKQKYPYQKTSYRQQLIAKYGPSYKTALFS